LDWRNSKGISKDSNPMESFQGLLFGMKEMQVPFLRKVSSLVQNGGKETSTGT